MVAKSEQPRRVYLYRGHRVGAAAGGADGREHAASVQAYVLPGRKVVVDVGLEKLFDRVNHDILIDRLSKRIDGAGVIRLIRAYPHSGIMSERYWGTPQGGSLSPLLANKRVGPVRSNSRDTLVKPRAL